MMLFGGKENPWVLIVLIAGSVLSSCKTDTKKELPVVDGKKLYLVYTDAYWNQVDSFALTQHEARGILAKAKPEWSGKRKPKHYFIYGDSYLFSSYTKMGYPIRGDLVHGKTGEVHECSTDRTILFDELDEYYPEETAEYIRLNFKKGYDFLHKGRLRPVGVHR